jgi:septal ring factor EnvC (AmiA/AmiB activator)
LLLIGAEDGKIATLKSEVEEQGKELRVLNQKFDSLATKVDNIDRKLTQILAALSSIQGAHLLFLALSVLNNQVV